MGRASPLPLTQLGSLEEARMAWPALSSASPVKGLPGTSPGAVQGACRHPAASALKNISMIPRFMISLP
jgi:hypothetical protein